jgi:outer membrane protein assembly factor BamB
MMTRLLAIWRSWSLRTRLLLVGGVVALTAGGAVAAYAILKRDADVECPPPCKLEAAEKPKPKEVIKTVNWPVYGYDDQRTRYLPTRRVRPPYDASEWSFQAGKLLEFSPVVADGTLYVVDKDARVYALDAAKGKVQWRNEIGDLAASSPAYGDGRVFVVSLEPGTAVGMRARDGKVLWQRPLPGRSETSPLVYGKSVIVGSESGDVFALDQDDGKVRWQVSTEGNVKGGLAINDGILYGANYAGQVFAIRASNGSFVWQSSTQGLSFGRGGPVYSTPAVAFGRVYLGSIDGRVYSFDADSGELLWSHSTGDWVYPGPAVADTKRSDPTVYIGSKDQSFYALDAENGEVRWQKDIGGVILGAATVLGEVVYVAGLGPNIGTFGFDVKTGKKVFESELGEYNPVISDGHRMYLTGSSNIRAFEHETEAERRREAHRRQRERKEKAERQQRQRAAKRAKQRRQREAKAAKRQRQREARQAKLQRQREARQQPGNNGGGSSGSD